MTLRALSSLLLPAAAVLAQVPTDAVLVLEAATMVTEPNYRLVDAFGRGQTELRGQNVFTLPSPTSVAVDPAQPGYYWFQTDTSSLPGTWRSELGPLAQIGTTTWGAWSTVACERVEAGLTRLFTLRAGAVESRLKVGGAPTILFTLPNAVDLAAIGSRLYVASHGAGVPAPVVEYDLLTGLSRTVGSYADVRSIAASPLVPELCLGLSNGDLQRVDVASGAITSSVASGLGAIVAVGYTRFGSLVWADSQQLWSELAPGAPVFTSSLAIRDVGTATGLTASVVPYGEGCGAGALVRWSAPTLPVLGNAAFQLGLRQAPVASFGILMLGASRTFAGTFGAPLPIDLSPIGANGCTLLVDPVVLFAVATDLLGAGNQPFPIPGTPSLAGIEWSGQWLVPDASVGSLGLATSEGVALLLL